MRVEEIGEKNRRFSPGGGLLVTVGIPEVTNKSHFKGTSLFGLVIVILLSSFQLADVIGGNGKDLFTGAGLFRPPTGFIYTIAVYTIGRRRACMTDQSR
jgi:hypothetical protein